MGIDKDSIEYTQFGGDPDKIRDYHEQEIQARISDLVEQGASLEDIDLAMNGNLHKYVDVQGSSSTPEATPAAAGSMPEWQYTGGARTVEEPISRRGGFVDEDPLEYLTRTTYGPLGGGPGSGPMTDDDEQGIIGDLVDSIQKGGYGAVESVADLTNSLFGVGQGVRDWAGERADLQLEEMSGEGRAAYEKELFTHDEEGNFAPGEGLTDWRTIALNLGDLVGQVVATGGTGGLALKGVTAAHRATRIGKFARDFAVKQAQRRGITDPAKQKAFVEAVVKRAKNPKAKAGETTSMLSGGRKAVDETLGYAQAATKFRDRAANTIFTGVAGSVAQGQAVTQARDQLMNTPIETLRSESERFNELVGELSQQEPTMPREQAEAIVQEQMAEEAANLAARDPALAAVNFATGGIGLRYLDKMLLGTKIGKTWKSRLAKGVGVEASTEGVQEGASQMGVNVAVDEAGLPTDTWQDVDTAAASGAFLGALLGGAGSGANAGRPDAPTKGNQDNDPDQTAPDSGEPAPGGPVDPNAPQDLTQRPKPKLPSDRDLERRQRILDSNDIIPSRRFPYGEGMAEGDVATDPFGSMNAANQVTETEPSILPDQPAQYSDFNSEQSQQSQDHLKAKTILEAAHRQADEALADADLPPAQRKARQATRASQARMRSKLKQRKGVKQSGNPEYAPEGDYSVQPNQGAQAEPVTPAVEPVTEPVAPKAAELKKKIKLRKAGRPQKPAPKPEPKPEAVSDLEQYQQMDEAQSPKEEQKPEPKQPPKRAFTVAGWKKQEDGRRLVTDDNEKAVTAKLKELFPDKGRYTFSDLKYASISADEQTQADAPGLTEQPKKPKANPEPAVPGDSYTTGSGRKTKPYPEGGKKPTEADKIKAGKWLIDEAIAEAEYKGEKFALSRFKVLSPKALPESEQKKLRKYVFGEENPDFSSHKAEPERPFDQAPEADAKGAQVDKDRVTKAVGKIRKDLSSKTPKTRDNALHFFARALGVPEKRKGESVAARQKRFKGYLDTLDRLSNETPESLNKLKVPELLKILTSLDHKSKAKGRQGHRASRGKGGMVESLLLYPHRITLAAEAQLGRQATHNEITKLAKQKKPIPLELMKKGLAPDVAIYVPWDNAVSHALGLDAIPAPKDHSEDFKRVLHYLDNPKELLTDAAKADLDKTVLALESLKADQMGLTSSGVTGDLLGLLGVKAETSGNINGPVYGLRKEIPAVVSKLKSDSGRYKSKHGQERHNDSWTIMHIIDTKDGSVVKTSKLKEHDGYPEWQALVRKTRAEVKEMNAVPWRDQLTPEEAKTIEDYLGVESTEAKAWREQGERLLADRRRVAEGGGLRAKHSQKDMAEIQSELDAGYQGKPFQWEPAAAKRTREREKTRHLPLESESVPNKPEMVLPEKRKKRLVIMPCSDAKNNAKGLLPAMERYTGGMWKVLKGNMPDDVDVAVLSAEFGLIWGDTKIPDYNRKLTKASTGVEGRTWELSKDPGEQRWGELMTQDPKTREPLYEDVLVAGSDLYRETTMRLLPTGVGESAKQTDGRGIGYQQGELKQWLEEGRERDFQAEIDAAKKRFDDFMDSNDTDKANVPIAALKDILKDMPPGKERKEAERLLAVMEGGREGWANAWGERLTIEHDHVDAKAEKGDGTLKPAGSIVRPTDRITTPQGDYEVVAIVQPDHVGYDNKIHLGAYVRPVGKPGLVLLDGAELRDLGYETEHSDKVDSFDYLDEYDEEFDDLNVDDGFNIRGSNMLAQPEPEAVVKLTTKAQAPKETLSQKQADDRLLQWQDVTARSNKRENIDKVIISLFDSTGTWSQPWTEAGFTVVQMDLNLTGGHGYEVDVLELTIEKLQDMGFEGDMDNIYGVLAACPCTDFASSGDQHKPEKRLNGSLEKSIDLVGITKAVIERYAPKFWAIENPRGDIQKMAGLPDFRYKFHPNHFGDPYTKETYLWGRFNTDLPTANVEVAEKDYLLNLPRSNYRPYLRSVTPQGMAYALFMANGADRSLALRSPKEIRADGFKPERHNAMTEKQRIDKVGYFDNLAFEQHKTDFKTERGAQAHADKFMKQRKRKDLVVVTDGQTFAVVRKDRVNEADFLPEGWSGDPKAAKVAAAQLGEPVDSRADAPVVKGMGAKRVQGIVNRWVARYGGVPGLTWEVRKAKDATTRATYEDGNVTLYADNLGSEADVIRAMRHEVLVHHGLRAVTPRAEYSRLIKMIQKTRGSSQKLDQIWADVESTYDDYTLDGMAEEVMAKYGEELGDRGTWAKIWDKVVMHLQRLLRRTGLLQRNATQREIRVALDDVVAGFRAGRIRSALNSGPAMDSRASAAPETNAEPELNLSHRDEAAAVLKKAGSSVSDGWAALKEDPRAALDWLQSLAEGSLPYLAMLVPHKAIDYISNRTENVPGLKGFTQVMRQLDARRERLMLDQKPLVDKWRNFVMKFPEKAKALADLMHDSTIAGVDPSQPYNFERQIGILERSIAKKAGDVEKAINARNQITARTRQNALAREEAKLRAVLENKDKYAEFKARYDSLGSVGQFLYMGAKKAYATRLEQWMKAFSDDLVLRGRADPRKFKNTGTDQFLEEDLAKAAAEADEATANLVSQGTPINAEAREVAKQEKLDKVRKEHAERIKSVEAGLNLNYQRYQELSQHNPYFPLHREGRYWVMLTKRDFDKETGELLPNDVISFAKFDSVREQKRAFKELENDPEFKAQIESGKVHLVRGYMDPNSSKGMADMGRILPAIHKQYMDLEEAGNIDAETRAILDRQAIEMYFKTLPEVSSKKHQIQRKGRRGYHEDALKAFASFMFHDSHQLTRLEHRARFEHELAKVREETKALGGNAANLILSLAEKRYEWIKEPSGNPWSSKMTAFGFVWYLGMSPAAALVNLAQTPMVTFPYLASKYGWKTAFKALNDSMLMAMKYKGKIYDPENPNANPELTEEERRSFDKLYRDGVLTHTISQDLAGIADAGSEFNATTQRAMDMVSYLFHNAEVLNRQASALAALRLAKDATSPNQKLAVLKHDEEERFNFAVEVIEQTHFDYGASNRPEVMQNDYLKVALLFRQYSINMATRMVFDGYDWMANNKMNEVEKREAKHRLVGLLTMTGLLTGASGLPLYWAIEMAFNALDDEDDPHSFQLESRKWLADMFGPEVAGMIQKGVVGEVTGVGISNRLSLNNLFIMGDNRERSHEDAMKTFLVGLGGALPAVLLQAGRGLDVWEKGDPQRAAEYWMPKAIKDGMRAFRYHDDGGAMTLRGDMIKDDFNIMQIAQQAIGFIPHELAEQYEYNNAVKGLETKLKNRRSLILNQIAMGTRFNDRRLLEKGRANMREWNLKHPTHRITEKTIKTSLRSRKNWDSRMVNGMGLDKNYMYLHDQYNYLAQ